MTSQVNGLSNQPIKDYTPKSHWDCNYYQTTPKWRKIRDVMTVSMIGMIMFITYYGVEKLFGVL